MAAAAVANRIYNVTKTKSNNLKCLLNMNFIVFVGHGMFQNGKFYSAAIFSFFFDI